MAPPLEWEPRACRLRASSSHMPRKLMRVFNPREGRLAQRRPGKDSEKTKEYSEISPNRYDFLRWIEGCDSVMPSAATERSPEASAEEVSALKALQSILVGISAARQP